MQYDVLTYLQEVWGVGAATKHCLVIRDFGNANISKSPTDVSNGCSFHSFYVIFDEFFWNRFHLKCLKIGKKSVKNVIHSHLFGTCDQERNFVKLKNW